MVQAVANYTPLTPLSFLVRSAYVFPDKTAVVYKDTRYTYRQLRQRVNRCATAFQAAGVTPGDRVAFLCPNIPPMLEAHYSVPLAGGVLVAINTRLSSLGDCLYLASFRRQGAVCGHRTRRARPADSCATAHSSKRSSTSWMASLEKV